MTAVAQAYRGHGLSQLVKNPDGLSCPLHGTEPTVASNAHTTTTSLLRITAPPGDGASGQTSLVF
jgi:hypothetical protein